MLKVKNGVKPKNLVIAAAAINAAEGLGFDVWITSGIDGKHKSNSKHYTSEALDLRRSNIPAKYLYLYLDRLRSRLGPDYDVILESDHIHCEFDPKPVVK